MNTLARLFLAFCIISSLILFTFYYSYSDRKQKTDSQLLKCSWKAALKQYPFQGQTDQSPCQGSALVVTLATGNYFDLGMKSLLSARHKFCGDCCLLSLHILTDKSQQQIDAAVQKHNLARDAQLKLVPTTEEKEALGEKELSGIGFNEESRRGIRIIGHHVEVRPWPMSTLLKFSDIIQHLHEEISQHDFFFFMDADTRFEQKVSLEEIKGPLTAVLHPYYPYNERGYCGRYGRADKTNRMGFDDMSTFTFCQYPYEWRTQSQAAVPLSSGKQGPYWNVSTTFYYQAALFGGHRSQVIPMLSTLKKMVDTDIERGVVAAVHDESHLNKYLLDKTEFIKQLGYEYIYPEPPSQTQKHMDWLYSLTPKIVHVFKDPSKLRN